MARGPRISIDDKIAKAQDKVDKIQEKLDSAKKELQELIDKKEGAKKDELFEMLTNSDKSYEEIMNFLKG